MKIIGLDLSLTATGVCLLDPPSYHTHTIKSSHKNIRRIDEINNKISLAIHKFKPKIIAIEGYSFGSRSGHAFSIGELGGVIKLSVYSTGIITLLIPPSSLKKFITGKGTANKEHMLLKVYKKYGVEFTDNNQCDAFCLAKMAQAYVKGTKIKYEVDALNGTLLMPTIKQVDMLKTILNKKRHKHAHKIK